MRILLISFLIIYLNTKSYAYDTDKYSKNGIIPYIPEIKLDLSKSESLKPNPKYIPKGYYPKEYKLHNSPSWSPPLFIIWPRY